MPFVVESQINYPTLEEIKKYKKGTINPKIIGCFGNWNQCYKDFQNNPAITDVAGTSIIEYNNNIIPKMGEVFELEQAPDINSLYKFYPVGISSADTYKRLSAGLAGFSLAPNGPIFYNDDRQIILETTGTDRPFSSFAQSAEEMENIFYFRFYDVESNWNETATITVMPKPDGSENMTMTKEEFVSRYGSGLISNVKNYDSSPSYKDDIQRYYRPIGSTEERTSASNSIIGGPTSHGQLGDGNYRTSFYGYNVNIEVRNAAITSGYPIGTYDIPYLIPLLKALSPKQIINGRKIKGDDTWIPSIRDSGFFIATKSTSNANEFNQVNPTMRSFWHLYETGLIHVPPILVSSTGVSPVSRYLGIVATLEEWKNIWSLFGIYGTIDQNEATSVDIRDFIHGNTSIYEPETGGIIYGGGGYPSPDGSNLGDTENPNYSSPDYNPLPQGSTIGGGVSNWEDGLYEPPDGTEYTEVRAGTFGYALTPNNVNIMTTYFTNAIVWENFVLQFFEKPSESIINLLYFPFDVNVVSESNALEQTVKVGNISLDPVGLTPVVGYPIKANPKTRINLGYIDIREKFGSFADFGDNTSIQVWLPFISYVDLPTDIVMDRRLSIFYDVSYLDGSCVAVIKADGRVIKTVDAQLGIPMPIIANDATSNVLNSFKDVISLASSTASGVLVDKSKDAYEIENTKEMGTGESIRRGIQFASSSTASTVNDMMSPTNYTVSGQATGSHGFATSNVPYLVVRRKNIIMTENYQKFTGIPTFYSDKVANLVGDGMTMFSNVQLNGFTNFSKEELDELKALLEGGVIL